MLRKLHTFILSLLIATISLPTLANASSIVADPNPPVIGDISIDRHEVGIGESVTISHDITDPDGIQSISFDFIDGDPSNLSSGSLLSWRSFGVQYPGSDNKKSILGSMTSQDVGTSPHAISFTIRDSAGYITTIWDEVYAEKTHQTGSTTDLSGIYFSVVENRIITPNYNAIGGYNSTYIYGNANGIEIRFDGPFDKFARLEVDDYTISESNYEARSGSTIIMLHPYYLNSLAEGTHKVSAVYDDGGRATTSFSVQRNQEHGNLNQNENGSISSSDDNQSNNKSSSNPKQNKETVGSLAQTGDHFDLVILVSLISLIALFTIYIAAIKLKDTAKHDPYQNKRG